MLSNLYAYIQPISDGILKRGLERCLKTCFGEFRSRSRKTQVSVL